MPNIVQALSNYLQHRCYKINDEPYSTSSLESFWIVESRTSKF